MSRSEGLKHEIGALTRALEESRGGKVYGVHGGYAEPPLEGDPGLWPLETSRPGLPSLAPSVFTSRREAALSALAARADGLRGLGFRVLWEKEGQVVLEGRDEGGCPVRAVLHLVAYEPEEAEDLLETLKEMLE